MHKLYISFIRCLVLFFTVNWGHPPPPPVADPGGGGGAAGAPPVQRFKNKKTNMLRSKYGLECVNWGLILQIFPGGACPWTPLENISASCGAQCFLQKSAPPPPRLQWRIQNVQEEGA